MKRCPYTRAAPSAGFYEQVVRNPAMPLGGSSKPSCCGSIYCSKWIKSKCTLLMIAGDDDPITPLADIKDMQQRSGRLWSGLSVLPMRVKVFIAIGRKPFSPSCAIS
jgi:hypothetical protein